MMGMGCLLVKVEANGLFGGRVEFSGFVSL